jgi:EAL domain-containing protein (putative c-di-GMP-specific phosphodiesterase class I)
LKIDQTFIREIFVSKENMAIVKAIIALAGDLQLKVIAEGVEDQEILEHLERIGCDGIQRYFISRPLCKSDFEKTFLTTNRQFSFR